MPFFCAPCERRFDSPQQLEQHRCGQLFDRYLVPDVGVRVNTDLAVMPSRLCPACARPYGQRKTQQGASNSIPAHNIISRDALKTADTMKRKVTEVLTGKSGLDLPAFNTFANVLIVYFVLHFEGLISKSSVPGYRVWSDSLGDPIYDWDFVEAFLAERPDYLFSAAPHHPFGTGDGDRDDDEFSYVGLLDILFGTLATSIERTSPRDESDWDASASVEDKVKRILASVQGLAPNDSYTAFYCQTQAGAQCDTCEKRQGEANLACRYYAAKNTVGRQYRVTGGLERWTNASEGLLSFVGLQFCCDLAGRRVKSIDEISERWVLQATNWQLLRHLGKLSSDLEIRFAAKPDPVIELLRHNFRGFAQFYALCFLRACAGDYANANGRYDLGVVSETVANWLGKADERGDGTTVPLNLNSRRFSIESGELVGGRACLLEPA